MNDDELVQERRGSVLVARLNRPAARNALSPSLMSAIGAALLDGRMISDIGAVVLTGSGDRAFCAGMDLQQFSDGRRWPRRRGAAQACYRFFRGDIGVPSWGRPTHRGGRRLRTPVGLRCDRGQLGGEVRPAGSETRTVPAPGAAHSSERGSRCSIALEMVLTGDSISADRAYEVGLVNAVVAPDEVLGTAVSFAERIAANGPLGVAAAKELVRLGLVDADRAAERLGDLQARVFASQDAREGALAFLEKRPPVWQGH